MNGPPGQQNLHMIRPQVSHLLIASRLHSVRNSLNSRAAPTKFVQKSLITVCGLPSLAMNKVNTIMHTSVCIPCTTSMCTAVLVEHVNIQHQCFTYHSYFTCNKTFHSSVLERIYHNRFSFSCQINYVRVKWLQCLLPTSDAAGFDPGQGIL